MGLMHAARLLLAAPPRAKEAGKRAAQAAWPTSCDTDKAMVPCSHAVGPNSNTSVQIWLIQNGMLAGVMFKFCKQLLRALVLEQITEGIKLQNQQQQQQT